MILTMVTEAQVMDTEAPLATALGIEEAMVIIALAMAQAMDIVTGMVAPMITMGLAAIATEVLGMEAIDITKAVEVIVTAETTKVVEVMEVPTMTLKVIPGTAPALTLTDIVHTIAQDQVVMTDLCLVAMTTHVLHSDPVLP